MWGPYYLCRDCGFTAEDDDRLVLRAPKSAEPPSVDLSAGKPRGQPPAFAA